jgi:Protein of unknown function (DUF5672)
MKLRLPNVTLVMIDATCPELARLSLEDSLAQVDCAEILVCSPERIDVPGTQWVKVEKWPDRLGMYNFFWYEFHNLLKTDWFLLISWDSWVIDATQWTSEFLDYDYVGAPWWYDDGLNVGHGVLRSRRLMRFLATHKETFPVAHPEDDLLSRRYRPALEREGFRWPSEQLASRFMFECTRPSADSRHFMFHDSFNFPFVLKDARLVERVRLMWENPYIRRNGTKIAELRAGRKPLILPRLAAS